MSPSCHMNHATSCTNYSAKGKRIPMTVNRVARCGVSVLLFLSAYSPCAAQSIERYLHKNASLGEGPSPELLHQSEHNPISPRQAASFAVGHLGAKGVTDIKICEVNWIAAPLGGYLVDAKGKATIKGKHYSLFRVGVRDGSDEKTSQRACWPMSFSCIATGLRLSVSDIHELDLVVSDTSKMS
jgi:hypothetical protein